MDKLSWNPPRWKSYSFDGISFKVELETGEFFTGTSGSDFITMFHHQETCYRIFGQYFNFGHPDELSELSKVLNLDLKHGFWPEYHNVEEFLKRYYERVAKIGNSNTSKNTSKICIETEFDITPKFTI